MFFMKTTDSTKPQSDPQAETAHMVRAVRIKTLAGQLQQIIAGWPDSAELEVISDADRIKKMRPGDQRPPALLIVFCDGGHWLLSPDSDCPSAAELRRQTVATACMQAGFRLDVLNNWSLGCYDERGRFAPPPNSRKAQQLYEAFQGYGGIKPERLYLPRSVPVRKEPSIDADPLMPVDEYVVQYVEEVVQIGDTSEHYKGIAFRTPEQTLEDPTVVIYWFPPTRTDKDSPAADRERAIVRLASQRAKLETTKHWLWRDERGTWEREARSYLEICQGLHKLKDKTEAEINEIVADFLVLMALRAELASAKKQKGVA